MQSRKSTIKKMEMEKLPKDFEKEQQRLEKQLQTNSLTIEGLHCLLQFYKLAETHFASISPALKNEYHSKYLHVLSLPTSRQLMKAKIMRKPQGPELRQTRPKAEVKKEQEQKAQDAIFQLIKNLSDQIGILEKDIALQNESFQRKKGVPQMLAKCSSVPSLGSMLTHTFRISRQSLQRGASDVHSTMDSGPDVETDIRLRSDSAEGRKVSIDNEEQIDASIQLNVRNVLEEIEKETESMEKTLEELTEIFAVEQAEAIAEINSKYSKDIAMMEGSKDTMKIKILDKLKQKRDNEKKERLETLKKIQRQERERVMKAYKDKMQELKKEERMKQFTQSLKSAVRPITPTKNVEMLRPPKVSYITPISSHNSRNKKFGKTLPEYFDDEDCKDEMQDSIDINSIKLNKKIIPSPALISSCNDFISESGQSLTLRIPLKKISPPIHKKKISIGDIRALRCKEEKK